MPETVWWSFSECSGFNSSLILLTLGVLYQLIWCKNYLWTQKVTSKAAWLDLVDSNSHELFIPLITSINRRGAWVRPWKDQVDSSDICLYQSFETGRLFFFFKDFNLIRIPSPIEITSSIDLILSYTFLASWEVVMVFILHSGLKAW